MQGQPHETALVDLSRIKMPELGGDDKLDKVNVLQPEESSPHGFYVQDRVQIPYYTLPAMETEYVLCCIAFSYLFVLTCTEVPWVGLGVTITFRLMLLVQSEYPPQLEPLKLT